MLLWLAPALASSVASPKVVGGEPSPEDRWPDAAMVYAGSELICTGVLVAPDAVLTAGHCNGGITHVRLGATSVGEGERIRVTRVVEYPKSQRTYDLALLLLAESSVVTPRTIARGCALDEGGDGAEVVVVGWGATDVWGEEYPETLMEGTTSVLDDDCSDLRLGCNEEVSPGGELRAGGNGVDACFGDSGGPLYLVTTTGEYLHGITSRGYDTSSLPCSEGGIYVRPDAVLDWIEDATGAALPSPTCEVASSHPVTSCGMDFGLVPAAAMVFWPLISRVRAIPRERRRSVPS